MARLDQSLILEEAFGLLNEVGIERFNMRALAARLSVTATALYWHFNDKDALICAMTSRLYAQARESLARERGWQASLRAFGVSLRDVLLAHRDAARLCVSSGPVSDPVEGGSELAKPLVRAGLNRENALSYEAGVISFVLGWCIIDQNRSMHAHLRRMLDYDASFEIGLEALIEGFAAREARLSKAAG